MFWYVWAQYAFVSGKLCVVCCHSSGSLVKYWLCDQRVVGSSPARVMPYLFGCPTSCYCCWVEMNGTYHGLSFEMLEPVSYHLTMGVGASNTIFPCTSPQHQHDEKVTKKAGHVPGGAWTYDPLITEPVFYQWATCVTTYNTNFTMCKCILSSNKHTET